jgi:hypothetical protein
MQLRRVAAIAVVAVSALSEAGRSSVSAAPVAGLNTSSVGENPTWFEGQVDGFVTGEDCPPPSSAPVYFRDDAVVVLEPEPGFADVVAAVIASVVATPVTVEDVAVDRGVRRLLFSSPQDPVQLTELVHAFQDLGYPVDVDYLHAILPNYQAKPDDLPTPADGDPGINIPSTGGQVAVIDVGVDEWNTFTLRPDAAGPFPAAAYIDPFSAPEFAGHGPFIADLIRRYANETTVELWPVAAADDPRIPGAYVSGGIDEFSLLTTIAEATGREVNETGDGYVYLGQPFDVLNLSLGGYGCAVYPHVPLGVLLAEQAPGTLIVAAAGNDGWEQYLFPAAFADIGLADELDARSPSEFHNLVFDELQSGTVPPGFRSAAPASSAPGPPPLPIPDLLRALSESVASVGSATPADELPGQLAEEVTAKAHPDGDCFSNRGSWVTTWAPGAFQIGQLSLGDWNMWSGSSFAAPRFTAAVLAAGAVAHRSPLDFWRDPASRTSAPYEQVGHPFIQFGLSPVLDSDSPECVTP